MSHRLGPLPLPRPLPPFAERRERSWVLSAGSRQIAFTRVEYHARSADPRPVIRRASGIRPTAVAGTLLALAGSAMLIGVAITSSRASAGYRYVVSVPLPPARPLRTAAVSVPIAAKPVARSTPRRVAATPAAAAPARRDTAGHAWNVEEAAPDLAATTAGAAIEAALATGRLQQWAAPDGGERGFVVVGPAETGTGGCRALSILTRRDGVNTVERRRECAGDTRSDAGS